MFANALHTHVVGKLVNTTVLCTSYILFSFLFISGHGLVLQHFRYNSDCDVYEELEPIDKNLQYDFNFQQATHLRREVTILPVSQNIYHQEYMICCRH